MAVNKEKYPNNEYHIGIKTLPENIPMQINESKRNKIVTPAVHLIFAMFEYLSVKAIVIREGKVIIRFSDSEYNKAISNAVGRNWLTAFAAELYKLLQMFDIEEFERNNENQNWKVEFEKTDKKLSFFLEKSIKSHNE